VEAGTVEAMRGGRARRLAVCGGCSGGGGRVE